MGHITFTQVTGEVAKEVERLLPVLNDESGRCPSRH